VLSLSVLGVPNLSSRGGLWVGVLSLSLSQDPYLSRGVPISLWGGGGAAWGRGVCSWGKAHFA